MKPNDLEQEFASRKAEIERALAYAGGTHTVEDCWDLIQQNKLQLWVGPHSVIITELEQYPQLKAVRFFLAAGRMDELQSMADSILDWARTEGCTRAGMIGRPGWARSWMAKDGWKTTHIVMERDI